MITNFLDSAWAFFISVILAYLLTPFAGYIARKIGVIDKPASTKAHGHPTPLLGGFAIYVAFFLAVIFTIGFSRELLAIFIGGTILLVIGIIDDRIKIGPHIKLFGQITAALTVAKMGIQVGFIENYYLSLIFTCFWIVGITNAINLLDNLNGLSAGIAAISAFFFGVLAWERGDFTITLFAAALCGSSLGFLRHNFPKARIFMGDAGSLFIGFGLSTIAILGDWSAPTHFTSLAIPIFVLGYPIFDTTLVTISRIRSGRSVFKGGKDHSSHRLALLGLKKRRAVLVIFFINFCLGYAGYMLSKFDNPGAAILTALIAILFMLALGIRLSMVRVSAKGRRKG